MCGCDLISRHTRFLDLPVSFELEGGAALDRVRMLLEEYGIERALVHGGTSTVVAIGAPVGEEGWRVGLEAGSPATVLLKDAALSVSGIFGRSAEIAGETVGHVIDRVRARRRRSAHRGRRRYCRP